MNGLMESKTESPSATADFTGLLSVRFHYRGKMLPILSFTDEFAEKYGFRSKWGPLSRMRAAASSLVKIDKAFKKFKGGTEFDWGYEVGSRTLDWQLDFMQPKRRLKLLSDLKGECERRNWRSFKVKGSVQVYTDF